MRAVLCLFIVGSLISSGVVAGSDTAKPDPEGVYDLLIGGLDFTNDTDGTLLACEAYRKQFPSGRLWLKVATIEFKAALKSPATMDRATDLYREIHKVRPDEDDMENLSLKEDLGLAFAKYGMVKDAIRLVQELAATSTVKGDPEMADAFAERLLELGKIGKPFRDFRAAGLDGGIVDTKALRGQVVVVIFWTPSDKRGLKEYLDLMKLESESNHDSNEKGLVVVGVVGDGEGQESRALLEANRVDGINVPDRLLDGGLISDVLNVHFIPETFLIGRSGSFLKRGLHGPELHDAVRGQLSLAYGKGP